MPLLEELLRLRIQSLAVEALEVPSLAMVEGQLQQQLIQKLQQQLRLLPHTPPLQWLERELYNHYLYMMMLMERKRSDVCNLLRLCHRILRLRLMHRNIVQQRKSANWGTLRQLLDSIAYSSKLAVQGSTKTKNTFSIPHEVVYN